jgi:hypothetical protein
MRAMLFGGGDWQDRHRVGIKRGEVARGQFFPIKLLVHRVAPLLFAKHNGFEPWSRKASI